MKAKDSKIPKWKQKLANQPAEAAALGATRGAGKANQASLSMLQQMVLTLQIHNTDYSKEDVLLNSEQFGDMLKEGDFIELQMLQGVLNSANSAGILGMAFPNQQTPQSSSAKNNSRNGSPQLLSFTPQLNQNSGKLERRLMVRVGKDSIRQQRFQISVLKQIADLHNLKANMTCKIRLLNGDLALEVTPATKKAPVDMLLDQSISGEDIPSIAPYIPDRVEIVFRDQLVSRRDMWKIQQFLDTKAIYKNKAIEFMGIRFTIRGLFNKENQELLTGVVKLSHSKFFYYSKSSQVYVLIELSEEMYDFDQDSGFTFNEKCIQFLKAYFERCAKSSSSHEVTIVLYSRLYYPQVKCKEQLRSALTEHYRQTIPLTDEQISTMGAFQISKHTKVFQDMYLKVGVFEIIGGGRGNWEKSLQNLKRYFNYLPSMLNWSIKCPIHVEDLKKYYPSHMNQNQGSFISSIEEMLAGNQANDREGDAAPHDMLPCWVGNAEKQSILEAINLALFNLNNEEEDQNLKSTGQQLLIVTAGQGTYRINANVIEPTKSRVLLGGIPIQLISLNHQPPFKTPLLVNCCTYANPFKNNKKRPSKVMLPTALNAQLQAQLAGTPQVMKSPKQVCDSKSNSNPPYYYPYWLDIIYLPFTKFFEVHGSTVQNPQSAIYKVQKIPPYNATHSSDDYHPLMSQAFLDEIAHVEEEAIRQKLLLKFQENRLEEGLDFEQCRDEATIEQEVDFKQKLIVMQTSDYCLGRAGSLSSSEKSEFLKQLEIEDALNFRSGSSQTKDQAMHKPAIKHGHQNSGSNLARRKEPSDITARRRSQHNQQTYFIMEEGSDDGNGDDIIVVERESMASLDQPLRGVQYEDTPGQTRDRIYTNQSNFAQSLQEKTSMDDLLSHQADPYEVQKQGMHQQSFLQRAKEGPGAAAVTVVGKITHRLSYLGAASPGLTDASNITTQRVNQYDPFSPKSKVTEHTEQTHGGTSKHGPLMSSNSFGGSSKLKFAISPLSLSPQYASYAEPPKGSPEAQKLKPSSLKNRWSHQAPITLTHSLLTEEELNVLLHFGSTQQAQQVMEPFWKSLCECKLMPLTTDYFPGEKMLKNTQKYHNELSQVYQKKMPLIKGIDDYLTEYICLRLTQNFQLINQDPNPTCNIDSLAVLQRRKDIKMSMGQKYDIFTARDNENYQIMTFTKTSTEGGREDAHAVKRADFKYMLFNFHTNRFQVKTSSESRLFNFLSLLNLSEVLNDLQMARQSCIKMPQNHFAIFFHNQNNWIFDKKTTKESQGGSLFPSQPGSFHETSARAHLSASNSSQCISSSFRSATVDISQDNISPNSLHQVFSNVPPQSPSLMPAQSIDLNQAYSANNLAQKLHQLYGMGEAPTPDELEIEIFNQFKTQLYDMLTKNKKSKYNTTHKMSSIEGIQISRQPGSAQGQLQSPYQRIEDDLYKPYEPQSMTATAFIEDDLPSGGTTVNGAYFFTHDNTYRPQHCFHITVSWIFANGPQISEKINSLKRKVKSCGLQIIPISGVVNKDELNPFENFTRLKTVDSIDVIASQRRSGRGSSSNQVAAGGIYPYNTHKLSLDSNNYLDDEASIPKNEYEEHLREKRCTMFIRRFEYFLLNYYGFVIESENKIYRNYIHFSGIAVIRIFHNSEVAWIENDVVNNQMADYTESHRVQEKVDVLIFSIDLILDMVFDKILLQEQRSPWKAEEPV